MKNSLNERLTDLISKSCYTQKELAEKAGITEAAMSHYIKGTRCPRPSVLAKLADLLNCSVDYLIGGNVDSTNDVFCKMKSLAARNASNLTIEERYELIQILTKNT